MESYILPNGTRVDMEGVVKAMLAEKEYPEQYLDTETGTLIEIVSAEKLVEWVSVIGKSNRYFLIPHIEDDERVEIACDFINTIILFMASQYGVGAQEALARHGWEGFVRFLKKDTDGWIHAWDQFIYDEAWDHADDWVRNNLPVPTRIEFEGCGNCAVCELMRKGEGGNFKKLSDTMATENVMQRVRSQLITNQKMNATQPAKKTKKEPIQKAFQFKITLNDSHPKIWRRIIVPKEYSFFDLHCAIQDAMGWTDSHLHAFCINTQSQRKSKHSAKEKRSALTIQFPNPDENDLYSPDEQKDERVEHIADYFGTQIKQCVYEYDFGDGWNHTVLFERELPFDPHAAYPQCTAGKNACPPEDCGGVGGYMALQETLRNKNSDEHEQMLDWLDITSPEEFDPTDFNHTQITFINPKEYLKEYEQGFDVSSLL